MLSMAQKAMYNTSSMLFFLYGPVAQSNLASSFDTAQAGELGMKPYNNVSAVDLLAIQFSLNLNSRMGGLTIAVRCMECFYAHIHAIDTSTM